MWEFRQVQKRLVFGAAIGCLITAGLPGQAAWTELPGCRLVPHAGNDGDSFHVRHQGSEYLFRLYFVDAPETNRDLEERIEEQADFWGISSHDVPTYGQAAGSFTRRMLSRGSFTVYTQWLDAKGSSDLQRFFAFVQTEDGTYLGESLVASGLGRVYGASDTRPDGVSVDKVFRRLRRLQSRAKAENRGAWGDVDGLDDVRRENLGTPTPRLEDDDYDRKLANEAAEARTEMATKYKTQAPTFVPLRLTTPSELDVYSIRNPGTRVGFLRPGTDVLVLTPPTENLGLVRIRFTAGDGVTHEAQVWARDLGLERNRPE